MEALIVADDLTGALDSAVALAGMGLRCLVARRPADVEAALASGPEVLAVSTASREGGKAAARDAVARVLAATAGVTAAILFKKIDSRLKGPVAAELRTMAEITGIAHALVAPAVPAQGRITSGGRLCGTGVSAPVDIAAVCAESGLRLAVPDAQNDADLDAALASAIDGPPTLLVGAAGLAAALARRLRPGQRSVRIEHLPGPLVLAIGSRDPITLAQVETLRAKGGIAELPAPSGRATGVPLTTEPLLVQLVPGDEELDPRDAGARFARTVVELVRGGAWGTLFACGGETADGLLGGLGVGVLSVEGELLPGVPVSRMDVNGRTIRLVTKSGGFGKVETLTQVVEATRQGGQDNF